MRCPSCGHTNPPANRFCGNCGTRLQEQSSSFGESAERRQLAVMFCDLVGSTELSTRLDVEELREVVRAYQLACDPVIARFDGYVAQYLGDGLLVYFGYPSAQENQAERAVRTGLGILDAIDALCKQIEPEFGIRLAVRIGIHCGPVVIGQMGGNLRTEQLALGETPNHAARLQSIAEPGTLVISDATARMVGSLFELEDLGPQALKGLGAPVPAYRVRSIREHRRRSHTPLVGRDAELEALADRFEQACAGAGQGVLLVGEAGIGKSQLVSTFRGRLEPGACNFVEAACSPYHTNHALFPVTSGLLRQLGCHGEDDAATKVRALEHGVELAGLAPDEVLPLICPLLEVPTPPVYAGLVLTPDVQYERGLVAICEWLFALARETPIVLVVEDLHWGDPSTIAFLRQLLLACAKQSILVVLTYRPELAVDWPSLPHVTPVALSRLTREQIATLVRQVAKRDLPARTLEQLIARTDGIPLFAEEITRSLVDAEAAGRARDDSIPATLQDSLAERLDQLGEAREVAQVAALIGREFHADLLGDVLGRPVGPCVETLVAAGLVTPDAERAGVFVFRHRLLQEAAYASLLRRRRRVLHGAVARALHSHRPAQVAAEPELLAYHYDEAGEPEQAARAWQRAATAAVNANAREEARGHVEHGLKSLSHAAAGEVRDRIEMDLRTVEMLILMTAEAASDPLREGLLELVRLCEKTGETTRQTIALGGLFFDHHVRGEYGPALERAGQALALSQRTGDRVGELFARFFHQTACLPRGRFHAVCEHAARTLELYDTTPFPAGLTSRIVDPKVGSLCHRALANALLGNTRASQEDLHQVEEIARSRQDRDPVPLIWASTFASWIALHGDRPAQAAHATERGLVAAEQVDYYWGLVQLRLLRLCAALAESPSAAAITALEDCLRAYEAEGLEVMTTFFRGQIAEGLARTGALDRARETVDRAIARADALGEDYYRAELFRIRGDVLAGLARDPEAETAYARATAVAHEQGATPWQRRAERHATERLPRSRVR